MLPVGYLQPINVPPESFFHVGLDLLGPFPASASGNKWVVAATDYVMCYTMTRALTTSYATDVADFLLRDVILVCGAPCQLLTDQGCTLLSKVIDNILRCCSTQYKITTSYHLQTNGLTEHLNQILTDILSKYVSSDHHDLDLALPYVTFAYNSSDQRDQV